MSRHLDLDPRCQSPAASQRMQTLIVPRARDIGGFNEVRLIVGSLCGETSPVPTLSAMFYADAPLAPDAKLPAPPEHEERALYSVEGEIEIAGDRFSGLVLLVLRAGDPVTSSPAAPRA